MVMRLTATLRAVDVSRAIAPWVTAVAVQPLHTVAQPKSLRMYRKIPRRRQGMSAWERRSPVMAGKPGGGRPQGPLPWPQNRGFSQQLARLGWLWAIAIAHSQAIQNAQCPRRFKNRLFAIVPDYRKSDPKIAL
jgi:hypothetical protein